METEQLLRATTATLRGAGCIAAEEEAAELIAAAAGDLAQLERLVGRRCTGEPLAWLVGSVRFCGEKVLVQSGVYVPRWQSEPLAIEAATRLPETGVAVDLCTGAGALAVLLHVQRPRARVVATEIDPVSANCARANGIEVFEGDLTGGLPPELFGTVDVVVGVVPYVPTAELQFLPRDVTAYEPRHALDGGEHGTALLRRAVRESASLLRPGGSLLLELGGDQGAQLKPLLDEEGYYEVELHLDEDGDLRALYSRR